MLRYEFMDYERINKIDIRKNVRQKYGIAINENSFLEKGFLYDNMKSILKKNLDKIPLDDINLENIFCGKRIKSQSACYLEGILGKIKKIVQNVENYHDDIMTDVYMGLLQIDKLFSVPLTGEMEDDWDKNPCNKAINIENVKKHYPYACRSDFKSNGIPGGCEDYHRLMMSQSNIVIFDIGMKIESIQRYAFPRTQKICNALLDSPIENLILLERTQGIGYTNQIFHYAKKINNKDLFDKVEGIIGLELEIMPVFMRKEVVALIWTYLQCNKFSEESLEYAKCLLDNIIPLFKKTYNKILEFCWYTIYLCYKNKKCNFIYETALYLEQRWRGYFDEDEVYESLIKDENLHDWRYIKCVDDCFHPIRSHLDYLEYVDIFYISTVTGDLRKVIGSSPKNELGEIIKKEAVDLLESDLKIPPGEKELSDLYYVKRQEVFDRIKDEEDKRWYKKDAKISTDSLKPFHIYALVHKKVVETLN